MSIEIFFTEKLLTEKRLTEKLRFLRMQGRTGPFFENARLFLRMRDILKIFSGNSWLF
jgi:hypothetical protein